MKPSISVKLTKVASAAARARVHDLGGGSLSILGVFDGDSLKITRRSTNVYMTIEGLAHLAAELALGIGLGGKCND